MRGPQLRRCKERQGNPFATFVPLRFMAVLLVAGTAASFAQPPPPSRGLDPYVPLVEQLELPPALLALLEGVHLAGLENRTVQALSVVGAARAVATLVAPVHLKPLLQPAVGPARDLPGIADPQSATANPAVPGPTDQKQALYLERLRRGDESPELPKWLRGLPKRDLMRLVENTPGWSREDQRVRHQLVAALIEAHGVSANSIEGLSDSVVLALADHYRDQSDKRCADLYEGLLARRKTKSHTSVPELQGLAEYYHKVGEYGKAAGTFMRAEEFTTHKPTLANSTVEAARAHRRMGNEKKAEELYEQVPAYGYGWATGTAVFERAKGLMNQGRHEDARRLLNSPVTGEYADQIQIVLQEGLASSYYRTGEYGKAREHALKALEVYNGLGERLLKGEGLEDMSERCSEYLEWIPRWEASPAEFESKYICMRAGSSDRTWRGVVFVRTFSGSPLRVECTPSVFLATIDRVTECLCYTRQHIIVTCQGPPPSGPDAGVLRVTAVERPSEIIEIPIRLWEGSGLRVLPPQVFFGMGEGNRVMTTEVVIMADERFRITKVRSGAAWVQAEPAKSPVEQGLARLVVATVPAALRGKPDGILETQISVETDSPKAPQLVVPCYLHLTAH